MTKIGLNVEGYDINKQAVQRALNAKIIQKKAKSFKDYDYDMLCVSTHFPSQHVYPISRRVDNRSRENRHRSKTRCSIGNRKHNTHWNKQNNIQHTSTQASRRSCTTQIF